MQSNVSRRNFFKGAGLAAVGALTAGTLSGCGQGYATADPANPSTGDFGGPSWLGAPPVIDEADCPLVIPLSWAVGAPDVSGARCSPD